MKFSAKLSILLLSITVSVVAVVSFVAYSLSHKALEEEIHHEMQSYAVGTLDTIDRTLFERIADMKVLATDSIISSPESTPKQIATRLIEYRNEYKTYTSLSFFDLNRIRIADTSGIEIGKQHKSTLYFQNALDKEFRFSIAMSESLKIPVIHFTSLVKDNDGEAFGLVVARMPLSKLHDVITPKLAGHTHDNQQKLEGLEIDLIDADGLLLYSNYNRKGILKDNLLEHKEFKAILITEDEAITTIRDPFEGDTDFCVHAHEHGHLDFPGSGWAIIVRIPVEVALAPVIQLRNAMAAISIAIVVIAIVASLIFSRMISKPITKLRDAAAEIGKGRLDTRIESTSKDEIGQLSRAFDEMTGDLKKTTVSIDELNVANQQLQASEQQLKAMNLQLESEITERKQAEEALQESEEKYKLIYETSSDAIMILKPPTWGFTSGNSAIVKMFGVKNEKEFISLRPWEVSPKYQPDGQLSAAKAKKMIETAMKKGKNFFEWTHQTVQGKGFFATVLLNRIEMKGKAFLQARVTDITERVKAEEQVRQQNEFLNTVLESLTHPFYVIDANDYTIKMANSALCPGKLPEKATCYTLTHKQDKPCNGSDDPCPLEEIKKTKRPVVIEHVHYDKDGNTRNVEVHAYPILDDEGNVHEIIEYTLDITERKQAEAKLKRIAEEWIATFDSITDMVSIHDKDFKIVRANKSFASAFKMKPCEIIGKTCYELIHGTKEPPPFCPHKRTLDTGKPNRKEFFEPRLGIHIEVSTSPIFDENGQIIASVHIAKDITERKQAESEIRDIAKFPSENSNPVLRVQRDGKILYSNDAAVPLLAKWKTKVGGAIPPKWRRLIDKAFESEKAISNEEEVDDKIFSFVVAPILDSGYANLYARDITEHRQAEEALRTNEAQLSNAMKIANLGYWEYDVADDQFTFNNQFYDIFHTTAKQVGGYTMKSARYAELFLHPDDRQVVAIETKKALETTDPQYNRQLEHRIVYATGEIGYISVRFVIVKDKQGRTIKTFGANQDITDRKRAEKELEKTHEKLLETSRMAGMAEVAADVLHNVGNVLNSINVSTTVIREKVTNSELANLEKVASIINKHIDDLGTFLTEDPQGKHIPVYLTEVSKCLKDEQTDIISRLWVLTDNVQHIKDIISMQQSYAKVSGVEAPTSLSKLAEDAIQINSAGLERHGTRLIREFDELGDVEIDKQKVLQILVNLVSNAKYALSGSKREEKLLTIRIYKHSEERFRIEVADNGVGISEDNLTKIFSHGFTTKKDGHGVGLHSSALAAKEMGGTLTVYSDGLGQGATFTLELQFKPVEVMK